MIRHASALQVLADPTRMQIVDLLLRKNYCVGALAEILEISAPAVSQHLKVLQSEGLVAGEKLGYHVHYEVNRQLLLELAEEIRGLAAVPQGCCGRMGMRCGEDGMRACMHDSCRQDGCMDEGCTGRRRCCRKNQQSR